MSRLKKFTSILFNPRFLGILSFTYGVLSFIRDEFLPSDTAEKLRLGGMFRMVDWYWWVIVGIVIWAISVAWESAKYRNENKTKTAETYFKRDIEVESTNQSGGITGNFKARDVYEGGVHFHGVELDHKKDEKPSLNDTDGITPNELNIPSSEKYYQIKPRDKSLKSIAKKEYGSIKFERHLVEANGKGVPPVGSYIMLPPVIVLSPASRENGQYASIRVQSKQTEKSIFCTPILSKALWYDEEKNQWVDKTEKLGDDERFLSWHHGSDSPEKEIKPDIGGIINIAEFTGAMKFTMFHPKESLWGGSYKVWILVKWRRNGNGLDYSTERIIVCVDTIQSNKKAQYPYELDVKECKNEKW